jgi:hypothetical protein
MPPKAQTKLPFGKSTPASTPASSFSSTTNLYDSESENQADISTNDTNTPDTSEAFKPLEKRRNKKSLRSSFVFKWMRDTDDMQHLYYNNKGKEEWRCRFCLTNYQISGGTGTIRTHLESHGIKEDSTSETRVKNVQIAIEQAIESAAEHPQKRRKLNDTNGGERPLDGDVLEVLYVKFIAACNMPLRLVECPEFRALLSYLNTDINSWLPNAHKTVRTWVTRQFEIEKGKIKIRLQNAKTVIHLSLDIWTSPSNKPIFGIIAHYISENGALEQVVLAMKEIEGNHKGENLAPVLMEVIRDWGIARKLGYIVIDNASNNDTMV